MPLTDAPLPTPAPAGAPAPLPPTKILLIEDNDDSRSMLAAILKMDGHDVHMASDGVEGVTKLLRERPPIAIVDIGLPNLDGYEVARRVRAELGQTIFLVALTGYGRPEDRQAVSAAGFDLHLVKPLKRGDLDQALRQVRK